ncbi:Uncharacterised protein [Mycobacterium tuberculosis]|uniref:Uncharacterized protein n=1 Tax=Mycobacterium tuberculosis TaxID=1773 RepID=A0A916LC97_MYCTX|nr:Uncharacterised protein [Mycobacterium tuberculosis]COX64968.1 Uncharacterised protein [Mycobacterium tuberculosis]COY17737.1 Uncharacterised protein [Mycobacterium tuberculosis]COY65390.1 Uncharacterised protein [Mycobacterium tuberculosis]
MVLHTSTPPRASTIRAKPTKSIAMNRLMLKPDSF